MAFQEGKAPMQMSEVHDFVKRSKCTGAFSKYYNLCKDFVQCFG